MNALEAWRQLNDEFVFDGSDDEYMVAGKGLGRSRSFSCVKADVQLRFTGWGLPDKHYLVKHERRTQLLKKRYHNPKMWDEAVARFAKRAGKLSKGAPLTFSFPFYRAADNAPAGGGCLLALTLGWWNGAWFANVHSRASEITYRLLADMYFVKHMLDEEVLKRFKPKTFPDVEDLPFSWNLLLASQMSHVLPYYFLKERGSDYTQWFMSRELDGSEVTDPDGVTVKGSGPLNLRERAILDVFWDETVRPDTITWAQRRRWAERFWEDSTIPVETYEMARPEWWPKKPKATLAERVAAKKAAAEGCDVDDDEDGDE